MKAISIRQPWAWLIVNGHKTIENRDWPTRFRGRVLIHASQWRNAAEEHWIREEVRGTFRLQIPADLPRGGIVGEVEITDCVSESIDPWFEGAFGFVLQNAQPLPFRPLRGKLSFFEVG